MDEISEEISVEFANRILWKISGGIYIWMSEETLSGRVSEEISGEIWAIPQTFYEYFFFFEI